MVVSKYWSTAWRVLAVSVPIGITISDVIGYVAKVEGSSMQPVLNPKWPKSDYVFLHSWPIARNAFEEIQRGDIVSLISPKNPKQRLIKRVIALQGDVVESKGGFLEIPDGHCWVEGDHRTTSYDSNSFGPVALGLIKSRACWVVWPPSRWQSLEFKEQMPESYLRARARGLSLIES